MNIWVMYISFQSVLNWMSRLTHDERAVILELTLESLEHAA